MTVALRVDEKKRRWSFRTRLTALIAVIFVAGGITLLGVQYLLVQGLLDSTIEDVVGCVSSDGTGNTVVSDNDIDADQCHAIAEQAGTRESEVGAGDASFVLEQTTRLSQEVLSGLLLWSIVTLLIFALIAVAAAWWLSRRSFSRIGQITKTTKRISRHDLHERLDLPGPADEIKELGDTIDTMLDRLETSFTQQERFITNASHELRTPLTTTRTALEVPLEQGRVPAHLEPAIRRALDGNRRSEQLIAALLELARTTAPDPAFDFGEPTDLARVLERSLARYREDIDAERLAVTTDLSESITHSADPTLVALAIDNLVANAVHHNITGGILHLATSSHEHSARIEIANSGPVLSAEETARLTEPFNRGQNTRILFKGRNLGLGLTLVRNIADASGATLTLSPRQEGGLTAMMQFPRLRPGMVSS